MADFQHSMPAPSENPVAFDAAAWLSHFESIGGGFLATESQTSLCIACHGNTSENQSAAHAMLRDLTDDQRAAVIAHIRAKASLSETQPDLKAVCSQGLSEPAGTSAAPSGPSLGHSEGLHEMDMTHTFPLLASDNPAALAWSDLVADFKAKRAAWLAATDLDDNAREAFRAACTLLPPEPTQPGPAYAGNILDKTIRDLSNACDAPENKAAWDDYSQSHAAWKAQRDDLCGQIVGPAIAACSQASSASSDALNRLISHRVANLHDLGEKIEIIVAEWDEADVPYEHVTEILSDVVHLSAAQDADASMHAKSNLPGILMGHLAEHHANLPLAEAKQVFDVTFQQRQAASAAHTEWEDSETCSFDLDHPVERALRDALLTHEAAWKLLARSVVETMAELQEKIALCRADPDIEAEGFRDFLFTCIQSDMRHLNERQAA
jgi:hypothetical protein